MKLPLAEARRCALLPAPGPESEAWKPGESVLGVFANIVRRHLSQWERVRALDPAVPARSLALHAACAATLAIDPDPGQCLSILSHANQIREGLDARVPLRLPGLAFRRAVRSRDWMLAFAQRPELPDSPPFKRWPQPAPGLSNTHVLRVLMNSQRHVAPVLVRVCEAFGDSASLRSALRREIRAADRDGHAKRGPGPAMASFLAGFATPDQPRCPVGGPLIETFARELVFRYEVERSGAGFRLAAVIPSAGYTTRTLITVLS